MAATIGIDPSREGADPTQNRRKARAFYVVSFLFF